MSDYDRFKIGEEKEGRVLKRLIRIETKSWGDSQNAEGLRGLKTGQSIWGSKFLKAGDSVEEE